MDRRLIKIRLDSGNKNISVRHDRIRKHDLEGNFGTGSLTYMIDDVLSSDDDFIYLEEGVNEYIFTRTGNIKMKYKIVL